MEVLTTFQTSFNPRLTSAARRTPRLPLLLPRATAFQSAPHFSSEANCSTSDGRLRCRRFQSAPHFSSEANLMMDFWYDLPCQVSIRASLQQRGERRLGVDRAGADPVSIRASLQQRGERNRPYWHSTVSLFQSAPHFSSEANATARPITSASLSSPKIGRCGP